jgi:hypothetical protein
MSLKILSIAIIGKQNQPLYIRGFDDEQQRKEQQQQTQKDVVDLKWHYVAHTSLDVFEERGE